MQSTSTSNARPTLCLNMIVKNESHIIRRTLEMLLTKVRFDYWVICDTGSTDSTREIIREFFENTGIEGELHCDEWVNFAHNRTLALNRAFDKTDLLLVFDADDDIHGTIVLPSTVSHDEYHLKFGAPNFGTSYTRTLLINNRKRFQYYSVVHEFISCMEPSEARMCVLDGAINPGGNGQNGAETPGGAGGANSGGGGGGGANEGGIGGAGGSGIVIIRYRIY